jgi:hypothetical protein
LVNVGWMLAECGLVGENCYTSLMRWIALLSLTFLAALVGCAQKQRVSADPLGAAPTDFAIELTILTGPQTFTMNEAHLRQSRYVMFADGSLYHGDDVDRLKGADWLPPLTRVLSRRQVAEVWSLAQQLGLTNPANPTGEVNFKLVQPTPDGVMYLTALTGWGERWTFTRPSSYDQPDPAMTQMARMLAQLAWASDQPPSSAMVMPKRYDFGPDPYARFRRPGGATAADAAPGKAKETRP